MWKLLNRDHSHIARGQWVNDDATKDQWNFFNCSHAEPRAFWLNNTITAQVLTPWIVTYKHRQIHDVSGPSSCIMMKSSNRNLFHVTGPLCGEFTGHRWIPCTKASDAELWCFSLICTGTNSYANNQDTSDVKCHWAPYDITVMVQYGGTWSILKHSPKFDMYNSAQVIIKDDTKKDHRLLWVFN